MPVLTESHPSQAVLPLFQSANYFNWKNVQHFSKSRAVTCWILRLSKLVKVVPISLAIATNVQVNVFVLPLLVFATMW